MCHGKPCRQTRCSRCSKIFYICVSCYRGQRYCCEDCRRQGLRKSRAAIQRRYRNSEHGKEKTKGWATAGKRRKNGGEPWARIGQPSAGKDENHTSPANAQRTTALEPPEAMVAETAGGERRVRDDETSSTCEVAKIRARRLSEIKLFAHRILPKIPPLSAFTTPPFRRPSSDLVLDFAFWKCNPPKSPPIPRCVGQKRQTPAVLGQFG